MTVDSHRKKGGSSMKKMLASILACVLLVAVMPFALAQTAAPGEEVTVEFPFSGDGSYLIHAEYTLSAGLSFKSGSMDGVTGGKAGKTQAIYVSYPDPATSGTLKLTLAVAADATGDQTVTLTKIRGYAPSAWHDLTADTTKTVTVQAEPAAEMPGDATGDGYIDEIDLAAIIRWLVFETPCPNMDNADANQDGEIDEIDLAWIIRYLISD
jgi:hypothetical protein